MPWNPNQYLKFQAERAAPFYDLLALVDVRPHLKVVDLGCGAGELTRQLADKLPNSDVTGLDSSQAMLDAARDASFASPSLRFTKGDQSQLTDEWDLIFSNAALHWLPEHATLIMRVASLAASPGVLAVQMPDNFRAPSHASIAALALRPRWRAKLAALVRATPTAPAADYYAWLAPLFPRIDIWTTEYLQVLAPSAAGDHPVAAWTKGTWLGPFLAALDGAEQREFLAAYEEELASAYPLLPDGGVLFPFRRLFIVANR